MIDINKLVSLALNEDENASTPMHLSFQVTNSNNEINSTIAAEIPKVKKKRDDE